MNIIQSRIFYRRVSFERVSFDFLPPLALIHHFWWWMKTAKKKKIGENKTARGCTWLYSHHVLIPVGQLPPGYLSSSGWPKRDSEGRGGQSIRNISVANCSANDDNSIAHFYSLNPLATSSSFSFSRDKLQRKLLIQTTIGSWGCDHWNTHTHSRQPTGHTPEWVRKCGTVGHFWRNSYTWPNWS